MVYYNSYCDYVDSAEISIPVDIFFNEEKIDKWIETKISERKEELEKQRQMIEKAQEEREKEEYARLKAKFED